MFISPMSEIRIISECSVKPLNLDESTHRIELTPWDLRLLSVDPIQKGLLFLKPKPQPQQKYLIHHLKTSLSRTLDFFPPLAGRLHTTTNSDNSISFFINCNNEGAIFTHATLTLTLTLADILDPVYVPNIVHSFFPLNGTANHEGVSKPLLSVQVTELADGFFIGCTINHCVADGSSFWHFFNSWSEISRGLDSISRPPHLKRWFPHCVDCPIRIPLWEAQFVADRSMQPTLKERVFHFRRENIAKLKAKANAEMGTHRISSLQALLAHLWRSVVRCRQVEAHQEINFKLVIGARPRLHSALQEGYFGNAVHSKPITSTTGELLGHGLGWAAWEMNKVVALETEEAMMKFYASWVKNPKIVKSLVVGSALITSSSPRFNVYGNDFGWGRPVAVRSGMANKIDGKITLFPGVEDRSVDIEVCVLPETLHAMGDDKEFMEAVTIQSSLLSHDNIEM